MSRESDTFGTLESGGVVDQQPVLLPCLTVLYHPEAARVGDRAILARQESGAPIELGRNALAFAPPAGGPARPLEDPHLSRASLALRVSRAGTLTLSIPARSKATLDGTPVEGDVVLDAERLARGALLELKRRVVLLVHATELAPRPREHGILGESRAIHGVRRAIERVADLDAPVLIRGETGVGKERVAEAIHAASGLDGPFVAINVATLTPALAASELFGHAKGAFTGAMARHAGVFERADGGTLFLDEVGELAEEVQPMLLRVLEAGTFLPVGDPEEKRTRVRVVAATDANLEDAVARGRLRAALYHRLRGFELHVPPLRERTDDVPRLALAFLREELRKTGELARLEPGEGRAPWIDRALWTRLVRHPWPGNVRQLRGVVRQIVVASRGEPSLRADAATERALAAGEAEGGGEAARAAPAPDAMEVEAALEREGWSFARAARALGMTRSALYRRVAADPALSTSSALGAPELARCLHEHDGDVARAAAHLRISTRALKLRMRALGLVE